MSIRSKLALVSVSMVIGGTAAVAAPPTRFTMDVTPDAGSEADTYTVSVLLETSGLGGPDGYTDPEFDDWEVVDRMRNDGTMTRFDPTLGRSIVTTALRRYRVVPKRVGKLRIGPARVRYGGQTYETRALTVSVSPAAAGAVPNADANTDPTLAGGVGAPGFVPPDPNERRPFFIHVVADKQRVRVGEQVIVTWLLYARSEIFNYQAAPPRLDKLWSETLYEPTSFLTYHDAMVGRMPYLVTVLSKRAIFPVEVGKVEVAPFEASIASSLHGVTRLKSKPVKLEVTPLPPGAPPGFDPTYVGVFTLEASVDRNAIDASQALTLTLVVKAKNGAIRRTRPPQLSFPGFSFREPRDYEENVTIEDGQVGGTRTYKYWTTPRQGGQQTIPPITVTFFNPVTEAYESTRSEPIAVMVRGDPGAVKETVERETRENIITRDIRLIRSGETISSRVTRQYYKSLWFWIIAGFPPAAFALVVAGDRVRERLSRETPRSRLRRARGRARQRFRVAEIHMRGNRPAKFFGELAHVIYDHIEERIGQPVASMTREELRQLLSQRGFKDTTIARIDASLESSDFARFAPSSGQVGEMKAALEHTRDLLKEIERTRLHDAEVTPE